MKESRSKKLLVLFTMSSLISGIVILMAIYFGIRAIYQQHIVVSAESESASISSALFLQESKSLTGGDPLGATSLTLAQEDFDYVDQRMHSYLHPFHIVKIKVFNKEHEIIYSTDPSIIGKRDAENDRLKSALEGNVISKLSFKDRVVDLVEEERFNVDVVETYLPVANNAGEIIGSFEIYLDVTQYREQLGNILWSSMTVIAIIMVSTYGVLFLIMRQGTSQLSLYESKLHGMAITDELTGIANRRFLMERAEQEFLRTQRSKEARTVRTRTGCILVDLDNFKKINDTYGHQIGDAVLREVAARLQKVVRRYDVVGRYGGEEFLIITPSSEFDNVKAVAERAWHAVRETPFEISDHSLVITTSVGFAITADTDGGIDEVIRRADESLYIAKSAGRDRVHWKGL